MGYTLTFLARMLGTMLEGAPLFLGLGAIIAFLGIVVGRREGWSVGDSVYFGFITATTVGYGDFRPQSGLGKVLAVLLALTGFVLTGILVAVAVESAMAVHALRQATG